MFRVGLGVLDILIKQEYICGTHCHVDFKATFKGKKPNIFALNFEIILPITFLETVDSQDCPQENSEGMCQRLIDWFGCWLNYLIMTTACILSHAHGCPWLPMNIFFEYTKAQVLYSYIHICASSGMLEGEETEDATFLSEGTTTLNANKMSYNYEDS
jgi:hypothetical protein